MTAPATAAQEAAAQRARLHDLQRAAWRVLELLDQGAIVTADARFMDAVVEAFDRLENILTNQGSQP